MKCIALDLYDTFSCMAKECPSTCCSGWKIVVDAVDYERFQTLEDPILREEIFDAIGWDGKKYTFYNRPNGSCYMLESDGLCHIQRLTNEKTLCNTCRKYPRITGKDREALWLSMSASCPVVSEYIVSGTIGWQLIENGKKKAYSIKQGERFKGHWDLLKEWESSVIQWENTQQKDGILAGCFSKMADQLMDCILRHRELEYMLSFFTVFDREQGMLEDRVKEFLKDSSGTWKPLYRNYWEYAVVTRQIEFPLETPEECLTQVAGELLLIRFLGFSLYCQEQAIQKKQWSQAVWSMYRFCAHGEVIRKEVHRIFEEFFSNAMLWIYVLW